MKSIESYGNNCTLIAVREVCRLPDEPIMKAFLENGYRPGHGMRTDRWIKAARDLGLWVTEVPSDECRILRTKNFGTGPYTSTWKMTLANVRDKFSTGTYFVIIAGHALVMRDGVIIDPNMGRGKTRATVYGLWRVENAPEVKATGTRLKFFRYPNGRTGPTLDRRRHAYGYIASWRKEDITRSDTDYPYLTEVIGNTTYTLDDFERDYKQGLVILVD